MKNLKGMCSKCPKYKECKELCQEAEEYVSQDHIPIMEGLVDINIENREEEIEYGFADIDNDMSDRFSKSRYRWAIIKMYEDGKSVKDIMYHVPYSRSQIYEIIDKYKKKSDNL